MHDAEIEAGGWEVLAVRHGRLRTTRADFYLNYGEYGRPDGPIELGYWFWVIRNSETTIVVDTGFSAAGGRKRGREITLDPAAALDALGIRRDAAVELVITHAHYDHAGNLGLFPTQPVHLHPAETAFWLGPDSAHRQFQSVVEVEELEELAAITRTDRVRWVSARCEIAPGVELVPVPGHTPGQLVVVVQTGAGRVVLASDACHLDEELDADMPFKHNTDLIGLYRGLEWLREQRAGGALIVAGHEPGVLDRFPRLDGALAEHAVRVA